MDLTTACDGRRWIYVPEGGPHDLRWWGGWAEGAGYEDIRMSACRPAGRASEATSGAGMERSLASLGLEEDSCGFDM